MTEQGLFRVIEHVYEASLDQAEWGSVARLLGAAFDAPSAFIHERGEGGTRPLGVTVNVDAAAMGVYVEHFASVDPWAAGWRRRGGRHGVFLGEELVAPAAFSRSEFYCDYARRLGIFHQIGATAGAGNDVLLLAVHRPVTGSGFTPMQAKQLGRVVPHMVRALQVQSTLAADRQREDAACAALHLLTSGVIMVRADETIAFANGAAEAMLRAGQAVTTISGRLRATDPLRGAALQAGVRQAVKLRSGRLSSPTPIMRLTRNGRRPLTATVAALPPGGNHLPRGAVAVVFLSDPETICSPRLDQLAGLYGLTPAQARLLKALIDGETLGDYAGRVAITLNTAQTHLKQLFLRTNTHRQSELIAFAMRELAGFIVP